MNEAGVVQGLKTGAFRNVTLNIVFIRQKMAFFGPEIGRNLVLCSAILFKSF